MERVFGCVIRMDRKGWHLKVQGVPNTVLLPFSTENQDSRNPDLLIGNVMFVDLVFRENQWIASRYELILKEHVAVIGHQRLCWEVMNRALREYTNREYYQVLEPEYRSITDYPTELAGYIIKVKSLDDGVEFCVLADATGRVRLS